MQTNLAKKLFAVGSAVAMVVSLSLPISALADSVHSDGTNVSDTTGTVYMILNGQRDPYTSAGAFLSYGFNSWSTVVPASAADLALPVGSFIAPQDGKIFCATVTKGSDVKGECSLISGGMKHAFTSAAVFGGQGFSFSRAQYGDSSFLTKGGNVDTATAAHLPGVLVNNNGTVQLVGGSGLLGIPDLATFNTWGYSFADVVPANSADKMMTQTGVMASRMAGQLSPSWTTTPGNPGSPVSGSVSASLASDSPAAQTVAVNASGSNKTVVTLAKFAFMGSGSVTQLTVKRIGVSPDSILSNVYLFDGNTRLTDAASVGGGSLITFSNPNGLFTVSGSRSISVVAEIPAGTSAGQTVGVQLTSFTVASGSPASVSVSGNVFTISQSSDLAYATFNTVTPTGSSFDPAKDVEVFRSNVAINTRDMQFSRFIIRNIGSAQQADMSNFRLMIDGTQVAQVQSLDSNGYAYFGFSPVTLKSGTRIFSVLADITGGSSRNFQFQVRSAADVNFVDTQYNTAVSPSNTFPIGSASSNTINPGTLTIQKTTDSPSGNVTVNTSDAVLAKYTVTAYGEPMKIETLMVGATSTVHAIAGIRNGRILINGAQYGSTATILKTTDSGNTTGGTTYTLNYTVMPGTPVTLEVHGDIYDQSTNLLANGDSLTIYLLPGSSNVNKTVSLGYTSYPSTHVAGSTMTVTTGSVTLSKNGNYANQTVPLPQTAYKLGSYNLVGSSSEDVNISSIDVSVAASGTNFTYATLNNVKAMVNGNMFGTVKSTLSSGTSTFSGSFKLAQNQTATVELWADMATPSVTPGSLDWIKSTVVVNGTTVNSSATVMSGAVGQQLTYGAGSLAIAQDPSTPVAAIVAGNQTKTVAAFKFTTANDAYYIKELDFTLSGATTVGGVVLKAADGTALTSGGATSLTMPGGTTAINFTGMNLMIPANSTKVLTVDLQLGTVGFGAGTSGEDVKVTLSQYNTAPSSTSVQSGLVSSLGTPAGNDIYVFKAIPTITNVALPTGTLSAGTNTLYKFSVSSGGTGTIGWTHMVFSYSTSSGVTLSTPTLWDADANQQIAASSSVDVINSRIVVDANTEQQISGAKNYALKATVGGTLTTNSSYITVNMAAPSTSFSGYPKTAGAATTTIATPFVWSDLSAQSHALTTSDWFNEYLIKNLPTDSETMKY